MGQEVWRFLVAVVEVILRRDSLFGTGLSSWMRKMGFDFARRKSRMDSRILMRRRGSS